MPVSNLSRLLMIAALGSFLAANLIHNRGGIDPAIAPGVLFTALLCWKPRRVFLALTAVSLALPAIAFFKWAALTDPSRQAYFFNHIFLLLTAVLALVSVASVFMPNRGTPKAAAHNV